MAIVFGFAFAALIVGIICCAGSKYVGGMLGTVVYWVGVVLVVAGLILLLAPVIVWAAAQIKSIMGAA